jgi:hypothetical protein
MSLVSTLYTYCSLKDTGSRPSRLQRGDAALVLAVSGAARGADGAVHTWARRSRRRCAAPPAGAAHRHSAAIERGGRRSADAQRAQPAKAGEERLRVSRLSAVSRATRRCRRRRHEQRALVVEEAREDVSADRRAAPIVSCSNAGQGRGSSCTRAAGRAMGRPAGWHGARNTGSGTRRSEVPMRTEQLHELLYQALETEQGGIKVYETAIRCARNRDLKAEWEEYLEQTQNHESVLVSLMEELKLDPELETPGREVVRHLGASLVKAMEMALTDRFRALARRLRFC